MRRKQYCQASITVEAVFLIPILLFVILAFMYAGLYFYDQSLIDTQMQNAALEQEQRIRHTIDDNTKMIMYDKVSVKGLENLIHNYDAEEMAMLNHLKKIEENMFQGTTKSRTAKIETGNIQISETSEISFLSKAVSDYLPQSNRSGTHFVKLTVHNPEEFVRVYTVLEEIVDQTEQGSKIKSLLKDLLKYM